MLRSRLLDTVTEWRRRWDFDPSHEVINPFVCHFGTSEHTTTQTTQQNNQPWAPQQPYLTSGFADAQNLLNGAPPQQQNPVAPLNSTENSALTGITNQAAAGTPITNAATGFATDLENGDYLNSNPANGYFSSLAGSNIGLTGPGATTLQNFANGGGAGSSTLQDYANGGYFSNGYSDDTAKTIAAQVIPQVAASFNRGNSINNPAAAFTAGQGVTAALAPIEYQNQQTQEQLQQQAADQLGANALTGASGLESGGISGAGVEATGASGLASNYNSGINSMVQGNALAPQNQALSYADLQQMFGAGQAQQQQEQNTESGQAATYNFSQLSPYQQLQSYMQAITGGINGGSSTGSTTTPYYTNDTANTLGTVSSLGSLAALAFL